MAKRTIRALWKTGSAKRREERWTFAQELKSVRERDKRSVSNETYVWHKNGGTDSRAVPYRFKGDEYRARRFFSQGVLKSRIPKHLKEVVSRKGMARVLDIGSAKGGYWLPFLHSLGKGSERIELHTLNPSNYYRVAIPTESKRQHVGAVETKNLAKLGRFDAITAFYSIGQAKAPFGQVINKLSKSLSKGGRMYVIFGHKGKDITEKFLRAAFGKGFEVETLRLKLRMGRRTFNNVLVVRKQ